MRAIFCGDREWADEAAVEREMRKLLPDLDVVIHGGARGADDLAGSVAARLGVTAHEYPAQWNEYGRAAGPIRNQQMLDEGTPDLVVAFHSNLAASKGTADMVRRAAKAGVATVVVVA